MEPNCNLKANIVPIYCLNYEIKMEWSNIVYYEFYTMISTHIIKIHNIQTLCLEQCLKVY